MCVCVCLFIAKHTQKTLLFLATTVFTRLALQWILVKGFKLYSFQLPNLKSSVLLFIVTTSLNQDWVIYAPAAFLGCGSHFSAWSAFGGACLFTNTRPFIALRPKVFSPNALQVLPAMWWFLLQTTLVVGADYILSSCCDKSPLPFSLWTAIRRHSLQRPVGYS